MEKYKKCPVCGASNSEDALNCETCDADIQSVLPVSDEAADESGREAQQSRTVKICSECGKENEPWRNICRHCDCDLDDVDAVTLGAEETSAGAEPRAQAGDEKWKLVSVDGDYTFLVENGETEIGRERAMADYLADKMFVSRVHGKLISNGDGLVYENLSRTNGTCVCSVNNPASVKLHEPYKLKDGDELQLGHNNLSSVRRQTKAAYFRVTK